MSIHHLPLTQVDDAALEALVTNAVAESRVLDYKERLPGDSDADKRELLADVSAFANSAGGDLIYGVKERRKGGATGEPEAVVGLPDIVLDEVMLRLDATLRTGMDPRIPGLVLHPVLRAPAPPCLVIRIPRSPNGIHMVTYKGSSRFYGRGAAGRFEMDWGQIRSGFCGIGSWGGQRPSLGGYVTGTGPTPGRPPPEGVHVAYPLPQGPRWSHKRGRV